MAVEVGQQAPEFALKDQHGQELRLADLRGERAVVLVFYPFAFTGTCTGELCELRDDLGAYQNDDVQVLAVSCDAGPSLRAFAEQEGFDFPLLSDFWPHGEVTRAYGVFDEGAGRPLRGTFVIDREGVLRWSVVNGPGEPRDPEAYKKALADL